MMSEAELDKLARDIAETAVPGGQRPGATPAKPGTMHFAHDSAPETDTMLRTSARGRAAKTRITRILVDALAAYKQSA